MKNNKNDVFNNAIDFIKANMSVTDHIAKGIVLLAKSFENLMGAVENCFKMCTLVDDKANDLQEQINLLNAKIDLLNKENKNAKS